MSGSAKERALVGVAMVQSAINLMEQINVEVGGDLMDKMLRDERVVMRTLVKMQQKLALIYDSPRGDNG